MKRRRRTQMGRKLEFNYERAVERATRVFWAKGYSAASMRDLLKAMGIGEGSFNVYSAARTGSIWNA